jgi:hypothetical protein
MMDFDGAVKCEEIKKNTTKKNTTDESIILNKH